jgi:hypothetical protein
MERAQLGKALGGDPSASQQLLLGPVARGTTISVSRDSVQPNAVEGGGR